MKLSERIKPISYLKANAAEVIAKLAEHQQPMIITVNGEAKAVLQDIDSYEEMQEAIALMKALTLTEQQVKEGGVEPLDEAFRQVRDSYKG
ncbi:prevent-host-death family protein [Ancylobacter novellus DSM 506]|jgi:prevent-host-death family protein|uniref:Antitoxin n=1 Tax=Ancylobacter novellus (strain ATCC 8093 / DSM 506 / JCM 20403 / CCM 1077 / IAM 12100 / NBRC 12443 / NCIMB 10456) TaxID=639283 RepID=D7A9I8_ANCN5|nr:type II toxin-antitoxin system Phd/YefM family antitoxin [Ancylobacter novellus]ADH90750.1 prevent-host-death family protein [Ancylobacter novellus DSM 506]